MVRVDALTDDQQAQLRDRILYDIPAAHAVAFRTENADVTGGEVVVYPSVDHEIQHVEQAIPDYLTPLGSDGFGNLRCRLHTAAADA